MPYQNILVAVDLGATTATVTERAATLASQDNAQLHVLHVIEPLAITYGHCASRDQLPPGADASPFATASHACWIT